MANQHSVIEHRANYFFLKIEEDYIAIFPPEDKHRHCKAAILSILEHWMNSKRTENEQQPDMYVYLSYPQFAKQMFDLFGRSTVIRCMKELVIEGLVLSHPYVDSFNQKTFAYMLNIDMINAKLRALPERKGSVKINGGSVKINDPHLKVNDPSSKNELPSFKSKRNIDYIDTNIDSPQIDKEEGEIATSNEDRNAPANITDFEEKRQRRGDTDKHKAVKIGDTNATTDLTDYPTSNQHPNHHRPSNNHPGRETQNERNVNHATTDHSTHSSVHPGEHHSDTVSEDICETRQDDGASSTGHAQEAGRRELEHSCGIDCPVCKNASLSSLGTPAPAQRHWGRGRYAVQGANQDKPPMALTARQIKAQNEKREKELWAIIEAERNTKYTATQRKLYENAEGMKCLIADDISDETIRDGLQALDAFQRKSFTILKFYGWLPNLNAKTPTPITSKAPSQNGYDKHELNMRKLEERKARLAAHG